MKKIVIALFFLLFIAACGQKEQAPDVSHIKVDLPVARFEQDFFSLDLQRLDTSLDALYREHPGFFEDFVSTVMAYEEADTAMKYIPLFIRDSLYRDVYKRSQELYADFSRQKKEIESGVRYAKHYFPKYEAPNGIITFIGPLDGVATGITRDNRFAIGLQGYLGKDYPAYHTGYIASVYPAYKSRKFEPQYIAVNCMSSLVDDIYPARYAGRPMIEQMIEAGKKLYVLDHLLPEAHDTLVTGYTKAQLEGAYGNEVNIWAHFLHNNLLYTTDPVTVRDYMNESPNTPALGPASPGFIGQFVGWQIIKKWMGKEEKSLEELLNTPAKQIFDEAKYKPS